MPISWVNNDEIHACPKTSIEVFVSFSIMMLIFLFGFAFSIVSIKGIISYKKITNKCVKLMFMLDILLYWIIYLLYLWGYYSCFQYYVESPEDHPLLYSNIAIIVSITMTLMILQFMVTQICCIERLYAVFKKKHFALKVRHLFVPIFFMIFGVIVMISAVFAYFISHIDGYTHWNDYIKYIFPFGILFIIVSRIVMVYVLFQQISIFIVEAILKWTKIKENAQNQGNPKASVTRQTITPYNGDDTLPSVLIPKKSNTLLSSTPETNPNANVKTGSIDTLKTDDWMEQLLPKMERIFRTGLKLTTITIFADIIMIT